MDNEEVSMCELFLKWQGFCAALVEENAGAALGYYMRLNYLITQLHEQEMLKGV